MVIFFLLIAHIFGQHHGCVPCHLCGFVSCPGIISSRLLESGKVGSTGAGDKRQPFTCEGESEIRAALAVHCLCS